MASSFDLAPRLAALQASGLTVVTDYKGSPSAWLQTALDGVDLRVINVKGIAANDTLVMVRLSKLEELIAAYSASDQLKQGTKQGQIGDGKWPLRS